MENVLVSVVIPCYNVAQYIEECLDAVYNQTYPNIEVIAVDNNSSDKTPEILRAYKEKKQKELIIEYESKQGATAARNRGLFLAQGDYLQFLDADDILLPDKIRQQIEIIKTSLPTPDLIVGNYSRRFQNSIEKVMKAETRDPWIGLLKTRLGITSANLWKRSTLLQVGGWNEKLKSSQETELMFKILVNKGEVVFDGSTNTIQRTRPDSISSSNKFKNWKQYIALREEFITYLKKNKKYTEERAEAAIEILFIAIRNIYPYDAKLAVELFNKFIPSGYLPDNYSKTYLLMFRLLGFSTTEFIRKILNRSLKGKISS